MPWIRCWKACRIVAAALGALAIACSMVAFVVNRPWESVEAKVEACVRATITRRIGRPPGAILLDAAGDGRYYGVAQIGPKDLRFEATAQRRAGAAFMQLVNLGGYDIACRLEGDAAPPAGPEGSP